MSESQLKNNLFDAKFLGESLKEVSMEVLQADEHDLEGRWYHSVNDVDLYIWKDESRTIIKQQLSFSGIIAEWNIVEGVKTGTVTDDEVPSKISGSATIEYHKKPMSFVLDQARQICEHIEDLSEEDRRQCDFNWTSSRPISIESFSDFLRHYKTKRQNKAAFGLWQRLKALILGKKP